MNVRVRARFGKRTRFKHCECACECQRGERWRKKKTTHTMCIHVPVQPQRPNHFCVRTMQAGAKYISTDSSMHCVETTNWFSEVGGAADSHKYANQFSTHSLQYLNTANAKPNQTKPNQWITMDICNILNHLVADVQQCGAMQSVPLACFALSTKLLYTL